MATNTRSTALERGEFMGPLTVEATAGEAEGSAQRPLDESLDPRTLHT